MREALVVLGALLFGCDAGPAHYAAALPTRASLAINVPPASAVKPALFYTMTRELSTSLDADAASSFAMIESALASPPTLQDATHAQWGPFASAGSPVMLALAEERVGAADYDFFLGGKAAGAPDSEFTGLLGGKAHWVDATHGSGELEMNFSAMNALDPAKNPATGAIAFVHDNTGDPRTVAVHFADFLDGTPGATPANATYQYAEYADASGSLQFGQRTNFDNDPRGILEDVMLLSRWSSTGAGRADVIAQNGSLPAGFVVHATECWDATTARVYYTEDVDPTKTEGSLSACALPAP